MRQLKNMKNNNNEAASAQLKLNTSQFHSDGEKAYVTFAPCGQYIRGVSSHALGFGILNYWSCEFREPNKNHTVPIRWTKRGINAPIAPLMGSVMQTAKLWVFGDSNACESNGRTQLVLEPTFLLFHFQFHPYGEPMTSVRSVSKIDGMHVCATLARTCIFVECPMRYGFMRCSSSRTHASRHCQCVRFTVWQENVMREQKIYVKNRTKCVRDESLFCAYNTRNAILSCRMPPNH